MWNTDPTSSLKERDDFWSRDVYVPLWEPQYITIAEDDADGISH